jgi:hypothetical protein
MPTAVVWNDAVTAWLMKRTHRDDHLSTCGVNPARTFADFGTDGGGGCHTCGDYFYPVVAYSLICMCEREESRVGDIDLSSKGLAFILQEILSASTPAVVVA